MRREYFLQWEINSHKENTFIRSTEQNITNGKHGKVLFEFPAREDKIYYIAANIY